MTVPRLANRISVTKLNEVDPHIKIVKGSFETRYHYRDIEYAGSQFIVPVDSDRLAPSFIRNSNELGKFDSRVLSSTRFGKMTSDAMKFVNRINELKDKEVTDSDLKESFYRALGFIGIQTLFHISSLQSALLYKGNSQSEALYSVFSFYASPNFAWIITDVKGILDTLIKIFQKNTTKNTEKVLALAYLADLPFQVILACIHGDQCEEKREKLIHLIVCLFDYLSSIGLVENRKEGTLEAGLILANPKLHKHGSKAQKMLSELNKGFGSLNWERRWQAIDLLVKNIHEFKFQKYWDSQSDPPQEWVRWAKVVIKNKKTPEKK
ncbi:MAG: hypothetical protein JW712_10965 [Dehalococcoidales bacterium]|nr:hypothetical protein [Dehalococcoidales bacterium]